MRARRGTRWAAGLAAVLVVVLALVVVDRVAAQRVRDAVGEAFTGYVEDPVGEPRVEVRGFPLLTQLASGRVDDVGIALDGATFGGIAMTDVTVDAGGVSTGSPHEMRTLDVLGTVPTASLEDAVAERTELEVQVVVDGDALTLSGDALGLPLTAALTPRVEDGRLLVDLGSVSVGGVPLDSALLARAGVDDLSGMEVPIRGLPEGLVLTSAVVHPDGIRITASGTDVTVPPPPPP